MASPGELRGFHESVKCECGNTMKLQVCRSNAGHYLGYYCRECGPSSRETAYYPKECQAQAAIDQFLETGTIPETAR